MKKLVLVFAAVAAMLLAASCNKEQNAPVDNSEPQAQESELVTIQVTIPEELSKVALGYTGSALELTWSAGDKIRVADHSNPSTNYQDFTLASGEGTKSATFTGTEISATSYDISIISVAPVPTGVGLLAQTQSVDGNTEHLGYGAVLSGVNTYEDITFSSTWATSKGGTLAQSGALHLKATLPAGVVEKVNSVTMSADQAIFGGGIGTMVVNLTSQADTGSDNVLDVYATIPASGVTVPSGTSLLFKFGTNDAGHSVYTRYFKTASVLNLAGGQLNLISLTCTNTGSYAGKDDDGTAEHPYLIADGYQLAAINSYASTSATTFIKLVDNIDMTGITHTPINEKVDGYAISVNFDGNNKTISKLGKSLFYVFKGTISNLTLDGCNVGSKRGIFAEYCQGTGHTITKVDITNGALNTTSNNSGAMIGRINSGSSGKTTVTIIDCEVSGTTVSGAGNTGGFLGSIEAKTVVTDCSTSAAVTGSGASVGGFVGSCTEAILTRCSATGAVVKNSANGNFVGGFAGSMEKCTLDGCFATGTVTTTAVTSEHVGGFIGNLKPATGALASIQNCYATGNVNGSGRWTGGFIGYIYRAADNCGDVEISKCHATGNVTVGANKNYVAGFIARSYMYTGSHLTIEKCYATGNVSAAGSGASAFFGEIGEMTTCTISDCYATGNVSGANQQRAGLVAIVNGNANTSATISRCYASGTIDGTFRLGGLIGNLNNSKATVRDCAAWNGAVTATAAVQTNWSSGAIIATAHPNSQVINNFRNPSMSLTVYCPPPTSGWDHPDIEGTTHPLYQNSQTAPFTWAETAATSLSAGTDNVDAGRWAYHGWHTAETRLSTLASAAKGASSGQGGLGWSSDVWDFTADLPTLK